MRFAKAYRRAKWAAKPPLVNIVLLVLEICLAAADFTMMLELANLAFDSDGFLGWFIALSVTGATIAVPTMTGQALRSHFSDEDDGLPDWVHLALFALLGFSLVALVVGVYWFRMCVEQANDLLGEAAGNTSVFGAGIQESSGGMALPKAVLLTVLMVTTMVVSFGRAALPITGPKGAIKARRILHENRLAWELAGERAADEVMHEEQALMDQERAAVDDVTIATLTLRRDLLALETVIDPAQAETVNRILREISDHSALSIGEDAYGGPTHTKLNARTEGSAQ